MTNKELIERYPFLIPRNVWSGKIVENYDYDNPDYILLDDMPAGWRKAFGEQMCEEIREELIKAQERDPEGGYDDGDKVVPYLQGYYPIQIKEKYGQLRWYDNGYPKDSKIYDIINKYEKISERVCINCGKPATWISTGWISPWCDDCKGRVADRFVPIDEWFEEDEAN
jgi:hypothetical protein